jgi:DNA-directed RNA polymerase subunit RPC12/RpoP
MQLIRDICSVCGALLPIVNKKYYVCDECNFKRLHNGKSKEEVYRERSNERGKPNYTVKAGKKVDESLLGAKVKRGSQIDSVSSKKRYYCSDGTLVSQQEIKWRLSITHDRIKQTRLPVCQGHGRGDIPLSFSHTISQARCKDLGKTELIWDEDNIELEGFHEPSSKPIYAHNIWEVGSIEQKVLLLNFERKLEYIALHDYEMYQKYLIKLEELNETLE